ncbi:unnamed protein product [Brachionus calyciflorus]|uniref:DDE-1 domain-containing protein n=1 Tax=Brachionus calyciflorus TaxID=104777 RepID=A0A813WZ87_9BILA|nr:unnamed protein product [Brachionus calyciflorus]
MDELGLKVKRKRTDLKEYELKNIYNLDESALFYRLQPNRTLATRAAIGVKTSKKRVSIGVCANADGSDKRSLIIIGRYAKPRWFGNFDPNSVVDYFQNAKAWMTFNACLSSSILLDSITFQMNFLFME